jgi:hypothetical protein
VEPNGANHPLVGHIRADWPKLRPLLRRVMNNTAQTVGGGGTRRRPPAPPIA